ncbi:hypothetical protein KKE06_00085 [Candidatus Micrarchaeota archaeon]|nr:hypothetical protein [Candidatus Micrarchaeota archaeon]MBU1930937.1 hypothetical protein [Candidatus Micrarchaeota archaeon]
MVQCHDLKENDVLVCSRCKTEFKVLKQCKEATSEEEDCSCHTDSETCIFRCCGQELEKK